MIVADSHVVLWLALAPVKLSKAAVETIRHCRERAEPLAIAACTLYEFSLTVARNRIGTNLPLDQLIKELTASFVILPITPEVAVTAATLPDSFPRDPFDRMIAATAIVHRANLITADEKIRKSNVVSVVW